MFLSNLPFRSGVSKSGKAFVRRKGNVNNPLPKWVPRCLGKTGEAIVSPLAPAYFLRCMMYLS